MSTLDIVAPAGLQRLAMLDSRLLLIVIAPFVGSFLGVVAERWPKGETIVFGRSHCPHCRHVLGARDLVPLLSWLAQRARCRYCGKRLSIWYPAVELAALAIAVWSVLVIPDGLAWASALFGWALLTLASIDLKSFWLPRAVTWPLAPAGLVVTGLWNGAFPVDQAIGAVAGYLVMVIVAYLYRHRRGREGLGDGDAHLFGALGAWVGWQGLPTVLLVAGLSGLLTVALQARRGSAVGWTSRIPFGPHLCVGGWLVWLYGPLYFEWW
jgi:leader peptidase (prepilin peptidase)/N-methyltransferase